jgi:adenosine kinase
LTLQADAPVGKVATALANFPKSNASRPRLVLITQGAESTLVASSSPSTSKLNLKPEDSNPKTYPVPKLASDKIVDTNGAGDAFAGGFLGAYVLGKTLDEAVEVGHKLGQMCVGQVGPTLQWPKVNVL